MRFFVATMATQIQSNIFCQQFTCTNSP